MYNKANVGYEEARGAVDAMVEEVKKRPDRYWQHCCVMVMDESSVPVCVAKLDGSSPHPYYQAYRKAFTSAHWRMHTSEYQSMISKREWSEQTYGPEYSVCPGGMAIFPPEYDDDPKGRPICLGAIGVSAAGEFGADEELARVGLDYIKKVLWPSK